MTDREAKPEGSTVELNPEDECPVCHRSIRGHWRGRPCLVAPKAMTDREALELIGAGKAVPKAVFDRLRTARLVESECIRWRGLVGTPTLGTLTATGRNLLLSSTMNELGAEIRRRG